ncbi:MAG: mRNA surveillance protein pelota [Candidatus Thermoplasmatota archaeon]
MRMIYKDLRKKTIKLKVETIDDLWHIYNILKKGDVVFCITYRKTEDRPDKLRPEKKEKKPFYIGLTVEDVEFHEFSDRLRIHGIIKEGIEIRGHHTINLTTDMDIKIVKDWEEEELERLWNAIRSSNKPKVIFTALEREEATIAILRGYGLQYIATIPSHAPGKLYQQEEKKDLFFGEVLSKLLQLGDCNVVLLGPGSTKNDFYDFMKEKKFSQKIYIDNTSYAGIVGINECIKRGTIGKIMKEERVAYEITAVENLLDEIKKNGKYSYGIDETEKALSQGAVEKLLITNEFLRTDEGEKLLSLAKKTNAEILIISVYHEGGRKLRGLGNVGAFLRYKEAMSC